MSENNPRDLIPSQGGILQDLTLRIKLILRLLADSRVNPLLKLIPFGVTLYFFFPDLAPGPIDDAAVVWLGMYLFVELCPEEVVAEHVAALSPSSTPASWQAGASRPVRAKDKAKEDEDVVDGEFREL